MNGRRSLRLVMVALIPIAAVSLALGNALAQSPAPSASPAAPAASEPRLSSTPQDRTVGFLTGYSFREHLMLAILADTESKAGRMIQDQVKSVGELQWVLWREIGHAEILHR